MFNGQVWVALAWTYDGSYEGVGDYIVEEKTIPRQRVFIAYDQDAEGGMRISQMMFPPWPNKFVREITHIVLYDDVESGTPLATLQLRIEPTVLGELGNVSES